MFILPKVPKTFTLSGILFKVISQKVIGDKENGYLFGRYEPSDKTIRLARYVGSDDSNSKKLIKVTDEYRYLVFLHELSHAICDISGYNELYADEKFVSTFSSFLFESIKTSK